MDKQVIITAKTVEEAMEQAKKEYGGSEWELSYEILEMPKRGFLGFGAAPAKIRVTITRALEEVNLADLVSEIRSMKITTDPDDEATPRPERRDDRRNGNRRPNQNANAGGKQPENRRPQQNPNQNTNSGAKPTENRRPAAQKPGENNARPNPGANPNPRHPVQNAKPAAPVAKDAKNEADAPLKAQPKPQPVKQEKPAAPTQPAAAPQMSEKDELPPALRPLKNKPASQNKPNRKAAKPGNRPTQPKENRPQEEKKKELMAAILEIQSATPAKPTSQPQNPTPAPVKPAQPTIKPEVKAKTAPVVAPAAAPVAVEKEIEAAEEHTIETRVEFVPQAEMEYALAFLRTMLADMSLHAEANAASAPEGVETPDGFAYAKIDITGQDTAILIGHHGETMDSIQYLLNLSALRHSTSEKKDYVKIVLDIENYRVKREETLRALARRMSAKAIRYKRNMVLEPMNPYERRIIHSEVQGIENVTTHSVGSDENRKIVIIYEGEDRVERPRDNRRRSGDKKRRPQPESSSKANATSTEETAKPETTEYHRPERRREKPVRAKSIDEIKIDLSEDSSATFGSLNPVTIADEGYEKDPDPIETIEKTSEEENLREY